jgi:hypothetical protein
MGAAKKSSSSQARQSPSPVPPKFRDERPTSLPYGGKVFSLYTSSAKEAKFAKSGDPQLPFKAVGTFWAVLMALALVMVSILMVTHRTYSPKTFPPSLLLDGSKF